MSSRNKFVSLRTFNKPNAVKRELRIMNKIISILALMCLLSIPMLGQEQWTLRRCLDYAKENNLQIQKNRISEEEGKVTLWQNRGALFPSLSFSMNQSVGFRPFEENTALVQNGQVTMTSNKFTEQGSYGLNANWTIWNGGINHKNIKAQKLQNQITELGTQQSELSIQEQIAQLYVQILYSIEAKKVNEQLSETAKSQYERGQQMFNQGLISKADLSQLEAQWQDTQYDIVNSETQVLNFKRQLKSLLELSIDTPFDVTGTEPNEEQVLAPIPSAQSIYEQALKSRPEIRSAELSIDAADMSIDIARRGFYPTIGMSASAGDSHYTASNDDLGKQMKTNLNLSAGINLSVPIFDNRRNKSAVNKAKLQKVNSKLDLQDKKNALASTIESYWLNANSNQQRFIAAKIKLQSAETTYELLNAQFKNGLKNIVELRQEHDNLIRAKQDELQSKYTTLLNMQLLKFYSGEEIHL